MKPRKLNLQEITKIYLLLKPSLEGLTEEMTVGDGIQEIFNNSNEQTLLECINTLYDNSIDFDSFEEFVALFVAALIENEFFSFVWIIKDFTDDASSRNRR